MSKRNQPPRDLCAQWHDDDGLDPRFDRRSKVRTDARRDLQLCRQVMGALNSALRSECGSAVLRELSVVAVEPAPDASRLRVFVDGAPLVAFGLGRVLLELNGARAFLRLHVGEAIRRKRVPELFFEPAPPAGKEVDHA
jgi:ribosome-binding factor A